MTRWAVLLAAVTATALLAALALQFIGGYAPCNLCIYERYPYLAAAVAAALGAWWGRPRPALVVAALALAGNVVLSGYHVGVEQGWFALPETCAAAGEALTVEELKAQILTAPPRCDQVTFSLLGLSLAAWNGLFAFLLLLGTLHALRQGQKLSS
jgi:disulfide bond formation protein DsbB